MTFVNSCRGAAITVIWRNLVATSVSDFWNNNSLDMFLFQL